MEPLDPKLARLVYDGMVQAVPGPEVEDRVLRGLLARLPHGGPPDGGDAGSGEAGSGDAPPGAATPRGPLARGEAAARPKAPRGGEAADPAIHATTAPASQGTSALGKLLVAAFGVSVVTMVVLARMDRDPEPPKAAASEHGHEGSAASTRAATVAPSETPAASTQRDPAQGRTPAAASSEPTTPTSEPPTARDRPHGTPRASSDTGTKSSTSPPAAAVDDLAAEIQQIAAADRALTRGDLRGALRLAREHAVAHPHGQLAIERTAIELGARCQLGEPGAAEAAATFLRDHADAPAAAKVRTRCASEK